MTDIATIAHERPEQGFVPRPITDYLVSIDGEPRAWLINYRPTGTGYYLADLRREPVREPGTKFYVTVATKAEFRQRVALWLEQDALPAPKPPVKPTWDVMTPEWVKALPLREDQK